MVPSPGVCPLAMSFSLRGMRSANTASATGPPGIIFAAISACSSMKAASMQARSTKEMPSSGDHHREAELVGALDVRLVPHRTARLHHRRNSGRRRRLDAVGERVERVGGARAAHCAAIRLLRRDLPRLHPVLLAGTDA